MASFMEREGSEDIQYYSDDDLNSVEKGAKRPRSSEFDYGQASGSRYGHAGSSADILVGAQVTLDDPAAREMAYKRGSTLYSRLMNLRDPIDTNRFLASAFMRTPSRTDYPDYFDLIKKPISFEIIKAKLDNGFYATFNDVQTDFNQLCVNAKRYNLPTSSIFLDAKRIHKVVKDTSTAMMADDYVTEVEVAPARPHSIIATTSASTSAPTPVARPRILSPKPQQQGHVEASHHSMMPNIPPPFVYSNPNNKLPGGPNAKKGVTTLKPWLTIKLAEVMALTDENGRKYSDAFRSLPARGAWPRYFQVIKAPISLDSIGAKCLKRAYLSVEEFVEDVIRCLTNAQYFNDSSSKMWADAGILLKHLEQVMKEVPPIFAEPRKYNTVRRRADEEARAKGLPVPEHKTNKRALLASGEGRDRSRSRSRSQSIQRGNGGAGGGGGAVTEYAESGDGSDYAVYDTAGYDQEHQGAGSPAMGTYELPDWLMDTVTSRAGSEGAVAFENGVMADSSLGGYPGIAAYAPYTYSPNMAPIDIYAPILLPSIVEAAALPVGVSFAPKALSKLVLKGDAPAIYQFSVTTSPASPIDIVLKSNTVRQHSFAVPRVTERIDFFVHFRHELSAKRKSRPVNGQVVGEKKPVVTVSARPHGTVFEVVIGEGVDNRYSLYPGVGLTAAEFVVRSGEDTEEEVYRMFVRR